MANICLDNKDFIQEDFGKDICQRSLLLKTAQNLND